MVWRAESGKKMGYSPWMPPRHSNTPSAFLCRFSCNFSCLLGSGRHWSLVVNRCRYFFVVFLFFCSEICQVNNYKRRALYLLIVKSGKGRHLRSIIMSNIVINRKVVNFSSKANSKATATITEKKTNSKSFFQGRCFHKNTSQKTFREVKVSIQLLFWSIFCLRRLVSFALFLR